MKIEAVLTRLRGLEAARAVTVDLLAVSFVPHSPGALVGGAVRHRPRADCHRAPVRVHPGNAAVPSQLQLPDEVCTGAS